MKLSGRRRRGQIVHYVGARLEIHTAYHVLVYLQKKKNLNSPIRMDEVADHWKKLRFDDFDPPKENDSKITISDELEVILEKFAKADDTTKMHIKEQLRKIAFPETTDLKPPSQPVKTKGAPKKSKITQDDTSTK